MSDVTQVHFQAAKIELLEKALKFAIRHGVYFNGSEWRDHGCGCCSYDPPEFPDELLSVFQEISK